jgi:hypothetical protein
MAKQIIVNNDLAHRKSLSKEPLEQQQQHIHPLVSKNEFLKMDLTPWEEPSFYELVDNTEQVGVVQKTSAKFYNTGSNLHSSNSNNLIQLQNQMDAHTMTMNRIAHVGRFRLSSNGLKN